MERKPEVKNENTIGQRATGLLFGGLTTFGGAGIAVESLNDNLLEVNPIPEIVVGAGGLAVGVTLGLIGARIVRQFVES